MTIVSFADHLAAISHTFTMLRFVLPMLCSMAVAYFTWCVVAVVFMYWYCNYTTVMPVKTTKEEVKANAYTAIPKNRMVVRAIVYISRCMPIYRWITVPAPVAIDNTAVVIRYIDNFRTHRFDNNAAFHTRYFNLLKICQIISFISLLS